ncbi:MAG: AAA family ATPase [Halanaerobiaceae bacterium]
MNTYQKINEIIENVEKVILGKKDVISLALAAMLSEGHILFEDVPGVGKTILARSLARSIDCSFKRIQFTPDLMPSDVTGANIFNQKESEFEFVRGPIFSQVVLADEINRATPRTQSSLLESMAEDQVTVEGTRYGLPSPFLVMATQNPVEYDGTFPLPEAQLDRFLIKLEMGYPDLKDEVRILDSQQYQHPIEELEPVVSPEEFVKIQGEVKDTHIKPGLKEYIVKIVRETRNHSALQLGVSPRGSLGIYRMSRSRAVIKSRDYVIPDDIKAVAPYVLKHRMRLKSDSKLRGRNKTDIIKSIIRQIEVPDGV